MKHLERIKLTLLVLMRRTSFLIHSNLLVVSILATSLFSPQILGQQSQTITAPDIDDVDYGITSFSIRATASSGLPVSYGASGPASVNADGLLTVLGSGSVTIFFFQGGNADYHPASPVVRSFTINRVPATVVMNDASVTYTGTEQSLIPSGVDTKGNALVVNFNIVYKDAAGTTVASPKDVGTYIATATFKDSNYDGSATGTLLITKATLTITADNKTKEYKNINPDFTLTYAGFQNDEDSSALTTQATVITDADVNSGVGTYSIKVHGAVAANYTIIYVDGTLRVVAPVEIAESPESKEVTTGGSVKMSVTASGPGPLSYQWYRDGIKVSGATSANLDLSDVSVSDAGDYTVEVSNSVGKVVSNAATLKVNVPVSIVIQPKGLTVEAGGSVSLNVLAEGTPPIAYQWSKDGKSIQGATDATLRLSNVGVVDSGDYTVLGSNLVNSVMSDAARVAVSTPLEIAVQPEGGRLNEGESFTLGVAVYGTEPLSYLWFRDGELLDPEGGGPELVLENVQQRDAGSYRVVVSDEFGDVTSEAAIVVVKVEGRILLERTIKETDGGWVVAINVQPALGTKSYTVEEEIPNGWSVVDISEGGLFDGENSKVKWGPWFDDLERTLEYQLTAPDGFSGTVNLQGLASFDGDGLVIGGKSEIVIAQGTVNFTNMRPTKQIIIDADGNNLEAGFAQLYAGTSADSLSAVGSPVAFYTGKKAGYFSGGAVGVGFNGAGFFQIKAWQGADTFEAALVSGASNVFNLTHGVTVGFPPGLPADLGGLEAFSLTATPPEMTIRMSGGGLVNIEATAHDGTKCRLEGSNDLRKWNAVGDDFVADGDTVSYKFEAVSAKRFYRFVWLE